MEPLNRLLRQNTRSIGDRLMLILFSRVVFLNILIQKSAKLFGNVVPSQCHMVLTIHIDRSLRFFERTWKRDTYICVTGCPRHVHNAPHHRHVHLFYSRSEERRVGKECSSGGGTDAEKCKRET